jgi:hypothetical protein
MNVVAIIVNSVIANLFFTGIDVFVGVVTIGASAALRSIAISVRVRARMTIRIG